MVVTLRTVHGNDGSSAWKVGMFRNEWTERLEEILTENTISLKKRLQ